MLRFALLSVFLLACVTAPAAQTPAAPPQPATPVTITTTATADIGVEAAQVLFWSREQKLRGFPKMDSIFPARVVARGERVRALRQGRPLQPFAAGGARADMLESFMTDQHVAGLLVLHDGAVRLERYALGHSPDGRWTSFSVAKSITSTLVGAAIRDGYIRSLDEPITTYLPELRNTAYDGVSVRHLLTMTSGVAFNEDYTDPTSDIARLYSTQAPPGVDQNVNYVRTLPREAEPGTKWLYKTPETNLAGLLVIAATGRPLADYLSEKIWRPYGMEQDATWLIDAVGNEQGGCCLQASLRDYARFGQFILDGATIGGISIVPDGWFPAATTKRVDIGAPGSGYGYQWWTSDDGSVQALGIFGQLIHIDPARRLVVVTSSAWPVASSRAQSQARWALVAEISRAIDAEAAARGALHPAARGTSR
jgi:CubicO group peptidase (beta-lactamase class C family)